MKIDGRQEYNFPFLEVTLGYHDVILGRTRLAFNDITPNCKRHRLYWPEERPKVFPLQRRVIVENTMNILVEAINVSATQDVNKREKAMQLYDKQNRDRRLSQVLY